MASVAQIEANRRNALKSTGPRTVEGKAKVAQNGVRHGLTARQDVIGAESQAEFDAHREGVLAELVPVGSMETALAERVASLMWRLRRAERFQNESIDTLWEKLNAGPLAKLTQRLDGRPDPEDDDLTLGRVAVKDFSNARVLEKLLMYERRLEHSLYRTLAELHQLRLVRDANAKRATGDPNPKTAPKEDRPCKANPMSSEPDQAQAIDTESVTGGSPQIDSEKANPIQSQCRPLKMSRIAGSICKAFSGIRSVLGWCFGGRGWTMAPAGAGTRTAAGPGRWASP